LKDFTRTFHDPALLLPPRRTTGVPKIPLSSLDACARAVADPLWISAKGLTLGALVCSFGDTPNLGLSHHAQATVCLTISRHVVLSALFPDAVVVGMYDRRRLIRLYAMIDFIRATFV
jgi:hypothetical protein